MFWSGIIILAKVKVQADVVRVRKHATHGEQPSSDVPIPS
jgi:hypothetical protein